MTRSTARAWFVNTVGLSGVVGTLLWGWVPFVLQVAVFLGFIVGTEIPFRFPVSEKKEK